MLCAVPAQLGEVEAALEHFERASARDPSMHAARTDAAALRIGRGEVDAACTLCEVAHLGP